MVPRAELARLAHLQAEQLARPEAPSVLPQPAAERSVLLDAVPGEPVVQQLRAAQAPAALVPYTRVMAHAAVEPPVWEALSAKLEAGLVLRPRAV